MAFNPRALGRESSQDRVVPSAPAFTSEQKQQARAVDNATRPVFLEPPPPALSMQPRSVSLPKTTFAAKPLHLPPQGKPQGQQVLVGGGSDPAVRPDTVPVPTQQPSKKPLRSQGSPVMAGGGSNLAVRPDTVRISTQQPSEKPLRSQGSPVMAGGGSNLAVRLDTVRVPTQLSPRGRIVTAVGDPNQGTTK